MNDTTNSVTDALMKFDPATGEQMPYPSHAGQWREWHGKMAWLFNPWTGHRRDARDVGSDVQGLLIVPAGTLGMDMGGGCVEKDNAAQVTRLKNDAAIFYEAAAGLLATNDALRTQLAEAQKNAERYLWMRDKETSEGWDIIGRSGTPDQIDAAIDAAKGEKNGA